MIYIFDSVSLGGQSLRFYISMKLLGDIEDIGPISFERKWSRVECLDPRSKPLLLVEFKKC